MYDDVTSVALQSALRGLALRQRVGADNIANIQTPGFLAGRVDFESALRQALATGGSADVTPTVARSLEPTRLDGNNVNLDAETLSGIDSNLRFQLVLRAVDDRFGLLRTAMRSTI